MKLTLCLFKRNIPEFNKYIRKRYKGKVSALKENDLLCETCYAAEQRRRTWSPTPSSSFDTEAIDYLHKTPVAFFKPSAINSVHNFSSTDTSSSSDVETKDNFHANSDKEKFNSLLKVLNVSPVKDISLAIMSLEKKSWPELIGLDGTVAADRIRDDGLIPHIIPVDMENVTDIEPLLELLRNKDPKIVWIQVDSNNKVVTLELNEQKEDTNDYGRHSNLNASCYKAIFDKQYDQAKAIADEMLQIKPEEYDYGDMMFKGNLYNGIVALRRDNNLETAKQFLLAAGHTPGSAVLGSFGPNMSLAKDLLELGERQVVLKYFKLCKKFWNYRSEKLDEWETLVNRGEIPDFGANMDY
ncbi:unnamed protein product [Didymodactylos carnosus]|uniref:Uncharacterized protein n=1 Tax=Didymodactylos carnosus TaxID=1234261 RepID=A0A8S2H5E3_9BILA|nr:unnamed protein product [Didymodactylos carnosus]CAF3595044.1 unnamed protein product [Didymodactylos carnosus]